MIQHLTAFYRAKDGAAAIEAAIILPACLMVTLGIIEFGRAMWTRNDMAQNVDRVERQILILYKDKAKGETAPRIWTTAGRTALQNELKGRFTSASVGVPTAESGTDYTLLVLTENFQLAVPFIQPTITLRVERKVPVLPLPPS